VIAVLREARFTFDAFYSSALRDEYERHLSWRAMRHIMKRKTAERSQWKMAEEIQNIPALHP
jgi:hypothetical protein